MPLWAWNVVPCNSMGDVPDSTFGHAFYLQQQGTTGSAWPAEIKLIEKRKAAIVRIRGVMNVSSHCGKNFGDRAELP